MDPFALTADAAAYLPREATESALGRLEDGFRRGRRVQVLSGPPGLGKTLLSHVLAARLAATFRSVYLPYASLGWTDLCTWILGLLGEPPGAFPDRELLASARRSALAGRPLLLVLDEASGIPPEAAGALAALVDEADGALRLLLVPLDDARAGRVLAVLARGVEELRLSAPLTLEETERYVRTRLVRAGVPLEVQRRFDAPTIARLQRASGGNVRRIAQFASEVMRGNWAALPGNEALEELGTVPSDTSDALELDARELEAPPDVEISRDDDLPAPASPATRLAPPPSAPRPHSAPVSPRSDPPSIAPVAPIPDRANAPEEAPRVAFPPPFEPREPERTNWWLVVAFNAAICGGLVAGLWWAGLLPPPQ
ncbi:MAG TPA: AAA family ATPase [Myxococcota bacterium]|nr:AAA family ATPase [Myxococcota bacterium]